MLPLIHRLKLLAYSLEPVASWDIEPDLVREAIAEIERLRKAADGAGDGAGWQPIETVPEEIKADGTQILVWKPDERRVGEYMCAAYWQDDYPGRGGTWVAVAGHPLGYTSTWYGEPGIPQGHPTHWRPLPEPPAPVGADVRAGEAQAQSPA